MESLTALLTAFAGMITALSALVGSAALFVKVFRKGKKGVTGDIAAAIQEAAADEDGLTPEEVLAILADEKEEK